jgi:3-hydroxyisobutyrate dehydrogenase-like beta-hydroxyacid dehydrogenase
MPALKSIGLIGLGLMGEVYASRLIAAGFDVIGFDVDAARNERLRQIGGRVGLPADVARACDPIVVAVFSTDQVEDVVERALLPAAAGKIVICTSTCDPDQLAALGARIEKQLRFLEAPVSGTSAQVRHGDGVGLIGGDAQVAEAAAPILNVLFPKRFHMGKIGDGGRAKLAVNLILGLNRLALAEGLVFAARQVMDTKGPKMVTGDFAPEGRVRQTLKDARLMIAQARKIGQELPLLAVHATVLEACLRHGEGERDNSIVIEEIRRRGRSKSEMESLS